MIGAINSATSGLWLTEEGNFWCGSDWSSGKVLQGLVLSVLYTFLVLLAAIFAQSEPYEAQF